MQVFSYQGDYNGFTETYIDSDALVCIAGSYTNAYRALASARKVEYY